jgi:non-ribosomal peptide synthetase component E (peptide arylation enzyme)
MEIEELIRSHPSVRDVAVVGYPDERLGERACACVVMEDGNELSAPAMLEFLLEAGLTKQKLPERWLRVDHIPLSSVGKPLKAELRKLVNGTDTRAP